MGVPFLMDVSTGRLIPRLVSQASKQRAFWRLPQQARTVPQFLAGKPLKRQGIDSEGGIHLQMFVASSKNSS